MNSLARITRLSTPLSRSLVIGLLFPNISTVLMLGTWEFNYCEEKMSEMKLPREYIEAFEIAEAIAQSVARKFTNSKPEPLITREILAPNAEFGKFFVSCRVNFGNCVFVSISMTFSDTQFLSSKNLYAFLVDIRAHKNNYADIITAEEVSAYLESIKRDDLIQYTIIKNIPRPHKK